MLFNILLKEAFQSMNDMSDFKKSTYLSFAMLLMVKLAPKCHDYVDIHFGEGGRHNGPKLLILAPQDIHDISGYQLGFGRQFVKAYNTENPVTNQKIL